MNKPKGKTPSLLTQSTGKPVSGTVGKKCKCARCKVELFKDQACFHIPKLESGFSRKRPFCLRCFNEILEQTKLDLSQLENELSGLTNE